MNGEVITACLNLFLPNHWKTAFRSTGFNRQGFVIKRRRLKPVLRNAVYRWL